ncbi:NAD-dependent epimerase/dehydratase family protein [Sphingobium scionense]|uniref:Nucleoside-diphosphate-sugar epimerase n=1 Tax=Sphingobium scionense TaxID=1404341 RepID=A0A7W6PX41_9SPHN|nr:NAD-dependent epimerase/dehydratase family protein [Sphingobium scionense]MBB4148575.1 nucleoside-diphosphate-sugar epimerase [Sphingobium scionense]
MRRALITGASGFTGHYMVKALAAAGHEVHALVQAADGQGTNGAHFVHACDLTDADACHRVVDSVRPEWVVHLAAVAFVAHSDPSEMYRTNILGTRNLLAALAAASSRPEAVLVASSANIYGNRSEGILDETSPVQPANDYGVSKAAVEMICRIYADTLPMIVTRPFNYTGAGQSPRFLVPKIIDHARRGQWDIQLGNIAIARDFSDVRTVVDAYCRLLQHPRAAGGTFQICSGRAVALEEILAMIETFAGGRFAVRIDPDLVRPNEVISLCGTPALLESVIGPLTPVPLADSLKWMLQHNG